MFTLKNCTRLTAFAVAAFGATQSVADDSWRATYNLYGTPGIIDLPSAVAPKDGEVAATISVFGESQRGTLTFQVLPRLSGSFRYSFIDDYDRSFDLQYQLADEGNIRPAIAIGLRDFIGTGRFSSEFIVATKTIGSNVRVSGGIGWGRLGGVGGFTNPLGVIDSRFEERPDDSIDTGGTVLSSQFFRGEAALFGGVEWRVNDEWTLLAEYSSDAYEREIALTDFERNSPLNFGVNWEPRPGRQFGLHYLYGSEIGISGTFVFDPTSRSNPSGLDSAPVPVAVRGQNLLAAASWDTIEQEDAVFGALGQGLATDGFRLLGAEVEGRTLRVRYENTTYRAEAQGVGRVARILSQFAPGNVDTFVLEPTRNGIALSSVSIQRGDLETLENIAGAAAESLARTTFSDAAGPAPRFKYDNPNPAFQWGFYPYLEFTLFDGDEPARGDLGIEGSFQYEFRPNLLLSGAYRQRVVGNRDEVGSVSPSTLPDVRRTILRYGADGGGIENLFLAWYGRPGHNLYSRVSGGYLERQFGGVSGEVLWKPVDSRLAIGAEVNYTLLRDFDLGFGFRPICTDEDCLINEGSDYDVVTGHVSGYYDFENGFQAQVDVGRYLAGDWGATFALDREFDNGWKIGAFFTLTNVDFDDFGEGSFDKGIRIEIPTDWSIGTPTRESASSTITSLERDGGARLRIDGRLYEVVGEGHETQMADNWGRFWR